MTIADDLFAGAGGWDVGAASLGIVARGVEIMPEARATRDAAGLATIHDDVWTYQPDGEAEGLIASPPCQTFSQAGRGAGHKALDVVLQAIDDGAYDDLARLAQLGGVTGDERTALVLTPLYFATHFDYRWLAFEQVPTVRPVWEACAVVLRELGWRVWVGSVNAERYGVPQTRRRAVLLASQSHDVDEPTPTHSRYHVRTPSRFDDGVLPWVSMAGALGWGMTHRPSVTVVGGSSRQGRPEPLDGGSGTRRTLQRERDNDRWAYPPETVLASPLHTRAYDRSIPRTIEQPAPTLAMGHAAAEWRWVTPDGAPRFRQQSPGDPDYEWPLRRPSTTVASRDLVQAPGETSNRFNTSTKSRNDGVRVSVSEAGTLQGFPADFPWQGSRSRQYLQVGNAVPPPMARAALAEVTGLRDVVADDVDKEETA